MKIKPKQRRSIVNWITTTNYSNRKIAALEKVSPTTVADYRRRVTLLELDRDNIKALDDLELATKLLKESIVRDLNKVMPDFDYIHDRMTRCKHMTLRLLHLEYQEVYGDQAYCYSQFTYYYRKFLEKLDISMRLNRYPGEAMFVDYAGTLIPYRDLESGKEYKAQIFVAVLGWSSYTFVHASRSQKIEDFIESHIRAVEFFGGTTEAWVPDNLKSAVIKASRDDLVINPSYQDCGNHCGSVIVPARVAKPQDKALAEQAVLHISRWITAPLLERTFFSVDEINDAIMELLPELNDRPMRDYAGSRRSRFEEVERETLRPLPKESYEYGEWQTQQKVPADYHIKVMGDYYSVPFGLVSDKVEAWVSHRLVNIFQHGKCVATHIRYRGQDSGHTITDPNHMPPQHLAYAKQGLDHYVDWARGVGANVESIVRAQYKDRRDQSMVANRACSNLQRLSRLYEAPDLEAACKRALDIGSPTVTSIDSILKTGLYKLDREPSNDSGLPDHGNVRGAGYYQQGGR